MELTIYSLYHNFVSLFMPTQLESQPESIQNRVSKLPGRLGDDLGERARDGALATYDAAIKKGSTPTQASVAARKVFEGILKPWNLL